MKLFMKIVSSPTLLDNISELDPLLSTDSWQTLMAFTRESARKFSCSFRGIDNFYSSPSASRPSATPVGGTHDDDIPQEVLDQIAADEVGGAGATHERIRICPHCTFENDHSRPDCDVCGLPL